MEVQFQNFVINSLQEDECEAQRILQLLNNYGVTQLSDLNEINDQEAEEIGIQPFYWKLLKQSLIKAQTKFLQEQQILDVQKLNPSSQINKKQEQNTSKQNFLLGIQSSLSKDQYLQAVQIAEQLELYYEMTEHIKTIISIDPKLTQEQDKLL